MKILWHQVSFRGQTAKGKSSTEGVRFKMKSNRSSGYSASVEAFVIIGKVRLRLAKTNGAVFALHEPASLSFPPPNSSAAGHSY